MTDTGNPQQAEVAPHDWTTIQAELQEAVDALEAAHRNAGAELVVSTLTELDRARTAIWDAYVELMGAREL